MAVSLSKGGNVSLTKEAPGLEAITVGLGWDARATDGTAFDLDASVFLTDTSGRVTDDNDFIFYNQPATSDRTVVHHGDNRTGEGEGDDERIGMRLVEIAPRIERLVVAVTIHDAVARKQTFGQVRNAFIRVVNEADHAEIARYDLTEDMAGETAMIFGEVYRYGAEWKFRAVGQGYEGGLAALARNHGINVD